ncbi:rhodanese-like domain-containing protein [Robiginitalea sp. SC105]|nr:rhodanese-like domain-containing protein [Robiginitalea sp. SC105]
MRLGVFLAFLIILTSAVSQQRVGSAAYDDRLEGLLSHSVPEATVPEARAMDSAVFLDARSLEEFSVSHVPGAYWVGYDDFSLERVSSIPKDRPVVVYCSVGYRSEKVSEALLEAGFTRVSNLYGGIFEWVNQGGPLVDRDGPTDRIHAFNKSWGRWLKRGEKVY